MKRPDSIRKLMQKDHEARAYINWIEKRIREVDSLKEELNELRQQTDEHGKEIDSVKQQHAFAKSDKNSNKKPGRPKGHEGSTRPIPEAVDETVELNTDECPECGTELTGKTVEVKERYVEDIEPARAGSVKYESRRRWCPECKKLVYEKPENVLPGCRLGINLLLFTAFYRYVLMLPVNRICSVLESCYGLCVSSATVINELNKMAEILGPDLDSMLEEMKHEHSVHGDETGHRINGENHWLWVFATKARALYIVRKSRGSGVPKDILGGDFSGVLNSDFWSAYNWVENQQKCWVHVLRKTRDMKNDYHLHRKLKRIFRKAKMLEKSELGQEEKDTCVAMLEAEIDRLKLIYLNSKEARAFVKTLAKHRHNLFRFVTDDDVDATNNHGERVIRPAVVIRKISGGNRSQRGARTFETNMSVMQTWKMQGKDFFEEGRKRIADFSHG